MNPSIAQLIPSTTDRVPLHTSDDVNARIRRRTEENIRRYSSAGPRAVRKRIKDLDREWDIERLLEANAATVVLVGCALGAFVNRRFFVVPAFVAGFLLQHAVQGWCPPLPLFRRLGVRTQSEIEEERWRLKQQLTRKSQYKRTTYALPFSSRAEQGPDCRNIASF